GHVVPRRAANDGHLAALVKRSKLTFNVCCLMIHDGFIVGAGKTIIINLLLHNSYPVIYHTDEFKKKATNYCMRFGHSLWSANQLPAQEVNLCLKIVS
ncbi:unnamed protein product, partial [Heterotrigona itama]